MSPCGGCGGGRTDSLLWSNSSHEFLNTGTSTRHFRLLFHPLGRKKNNQGEVPGAVMIPPFETRFLPNRTLSQEVGEKLPSFWLLILAHTEYEKRNRGSDVFVPITTISGWAFCKYNSPPHLAMRGPKSVQLSCFLYQVIPTFPAQLLTHSHQRDSDGWMDGFPALFIFLQPHLPTPCNWAPTGYAVFCQTPTGLQGSEDLQMLGSWFYRGVCEWWSINIHGFYTNQSSKWPVHWLHYQPLGLESCVEETRDALRMTEKAESIKRQMGSVGQEVRERRGSDCEGCG